MGKIENIAGNKYHRLTALSFSHLCNKTRKAVWLCRCDCGNHSYVRANSLKHGHTKSCGCQKIESTIACKRTHGEAHQRTREYSSWSAMINRCTNKNFTYYHRYGGRGISVHESWFSYEKFISDMGRCPDGYTLERKDNNGNYEPGNCKWASREEQCSNREVTIKITHNGNLIPIALFAKTYNLRYKRVNKWFKRGLSSYQILSKCGVAFLFLIALSSCSANWHLKRAQRHERIALQNGAEIKTDTVYATVGLQTHEIRVDTVFRNVTFLDTLIVTKENVVTRVKVNPVLRTVYVNTTVKPDTIKVRVPVRVEKVIYAPQKGLKLWQWILIALAAGTLFGIWVNRR